MRVAIVHDYLTQRGGAERVVLSLLRLFPDADLYTSVYDPAGTYPEFCAYEVRTSKLQRLMRPGRDARRLLPLYPRAFARLRLRGYDLVMSSSSAFAHGVRVLEGTHVVYCHNPPRFLHQTDTYLTEDSGVSGPARLALVPVLSAMRRWDRRAARRADVYVANSATVAQRIENCYGRSSTVVSPPVDVSRIVAGAREPSGGDRFVLVISRLLPYKRVDLAVAACQRLGLRLVVVGEGPCFPAIRAMAAPTTELRVRVSDSELNGLLHGCSALIQAGTEDFGLVPLEANAAGAPVIAYADGGALETVLDGKTGVLVYEQTVEGFVEALQRMRRIEWCREDLLEHAISFGEQRFHAEMLRLLEASVTTASAPAPLSAADAPLEPAGLGSLGA